MKRTRAQLIIERKAETRSNVLAFTGMNEEQLNTMQWNVALEVIQRVVRDDNYGKYELPKNSQFWDWWLDQWHRRDLIFLENLQFNAELMKFTITLPQENNMRVVLPSDEEILIAYKKYHKVEQSNELINGSVMEVSFYSMLLRISTENR